MNLKELFRVVMSEPDTVEAALKLVTCPKLTDVIKSLGDNKLYLLGEYTDDAVVENPVHSLIIVLEGMRDGIRDSTVGICGNVATAYYGVLSSTVMEEACKGWEHYSGLKSYPIAYGSGAKHSYHTTTDLWVGEYGRRRLELLERMIECLKNK